MSHPKAIEKMSFEEALAELEEIVRKIDTGQEELSMAVESFERGMLLKQHCESMLNHAKLKIDKITGCSGGEAQTVEVEF